MPLKYFKNKKTGEVRRSLKTLPMDEWEEQMIPSETKFTVKANPGLRTSKLKDSDKILKARARNHSRDIELDDNIHINRSNGLETQVKQAFLNHQGKRRRKIDDI